MGFRVYFANDQTGIQDAHHTKLLFDTVHYDVDGWWDATAKIWRPQFSQPTLVHIDCHDVWGAPASGGYAKIWSHWQKLENNIAVDAPHGNQGEGRRDGPLSAANAGVNYHDQRLVQPGEFMHMGFMGFSGANGHAIQSGSGDDPDGTRFRSYLAVSH